MASPIVEGTYSASPYSSRDIDILKEKIFIKLSSDFKTAKFNIEYNIKTDIDGKQIPLLFYAKDYKDGFKVTIDGKPIELIEIPEDYTKTEGTPFEKFSDSFIKPDEEGGVEYVKIYWYKNSGYRYYLRDLKYFEVDLSAGEHKILVEYTADAWVDRYNWVKEYSIRYSLYPARYWKSFGELEITIDATELKSEYKTNLGFPGTGDINKVGVWKFNAIPEDYIVLEYYPPISGYANFLLTLQPSGMTAIVSVILILLHLIFIYLYRKKNPAKKFSLAVILGSLVIPLIILWFYVYSFDIIDSAIGNEAGSYHGYTFLSIALYPFLMPVYLVVMWLIDWMVKKKV
ncbi:MAG TPA: hypothetical protein PLG90_08785 [Ignavibacteria bacterium]|nr:hypothetical protein [Ignavibacteria bacterium]